MQTFMLRSQMCQSPIYINMFLFVKSKIANHILLIFDLLCITTVNRKAVFIMVFTWNKSTFLTTTWEILLSILQYVCHNVHTIQKIDLKFLQSILKTSSDFNNL